MKKSQLQKYAKLIARKGVNVQKGQHLSRVREKILKKDPALINARPKENISPQNTRIPV